MELQGKVALDRARIRDRRGGGSPLAQAGARVGALGHTGDELQATVARIRDERRRGHAAAGRRRQPR